MMKSHPVGLIATPLLALLLCLGCASPDASDSPAATSEPGAAATPAGEVTGIELKVSPLLDLYFSIRALAAAEGDPPAGYEEAVDAARGLQQWMGSFGGWGPLDSQVFGAADAAELVTGFSELPEPYERHGRQISIRDDAVRLARALEQLMPGFLAEAWPARKAGLERRIAGLEAGFLRRDREALTFMLKSLGIPDPGLKVPMYLVTATNPPGAMTYHLRGGAGASVLAATVGGSDALLRETILHEACHVLDMAAGDSGSAFATLRELLQERGLTPRDDAYHTIPHTLMFVQAEETMRRLFDPHHQAYGDATDLYQRTGETAVVEREIWPRFLDGELTREAALRQIVERLDPQPDGP